VPAETLPSWGASNRVTSFSFYYAGGPPGGATITATFDIHLTLNLSFASQVGGGQGATVAITTSSLGVSNASFTSDKILIKVFGGQSLKQAATGMDAVSISPAASLLGLDKQVASFNATLLATPASVAPNVAPRRVVVRLAWLPPSDPTVMESPVFDLSVTVGAYNLDLVFSHGAIPPSPPVVCEFGSSSATATAIYAECSPGQPAEVSQLELFQGQDGAWTFLGPQAASGS
jgi:hypothetical protein